MSEIPKFDVFISYAHDDRDHAEGLHRLLEAKGFVSSFEDCNSSYWNSREEIFEAVYSSAVCLLVIGARKNSPWWDDYIGEAIDKRVSTSHGEFRVVSVLFSSAPRQFLDRWNAQADLPFESEGIVYYPDSIDDTEKLHELILLIRGVERRPFLASSELCKSARRRAQKTLDVDWEQLWSNHQSHTQPQLIRFHRFEAQKDLEPFSSDWSQFFDLTFVSREISHEQKSFVFPQNVDHDVTTSSVLNACKAQPTSLYDTCKELRRILSNLLPFDPKPDRSSFSKYHSQDLSGFGFSDDGNFQPAHFDARPTRVSNDERQSERCDRNLFRYYQGIPNLTSISAVSNKWQPPVAAPYIHVATPGLKQCGKDWLYAPHHASELLAESPIVHTCHPFEDEIKFYLIIFDSCVFAEIQFGSSVFAEVQFALREKVSVISKDGGPIHKVWTACLEHNVLNKESEQSTPLDLLGSIGDSLSTTALEEMSRGNSQYPSVTTQQSTMTDRRVVLSFCTKIRNYSYGQFIFGCICKEIESCRDDVAENITVYRSPKYEAVEGSCPMAEWRSLSELFRETGRVPFYQTISPVD